MANTNANETHITPAMTDADNGVSKVDDDDT